MTALEEFAAETPSPLPFTVVMRQDGSYTVTCHGSPVVTVHREIFGCQADRAAGRLRELLEKEARRCA